MSQDACWVLACNLTCFSFVDDAKLWGFENLTNIFFLFSLFFAVLLMYINICVRTHNKNSLFCVRTQSHFLVRGQNTLTSDEKVFSTYTYVKMNELFQTSWNKGRQKKKAENKHFPKKTWVFEKIKVFLHLHLIQHTINNSINNLNFQHSYVVM